MAATKVPKIAKVTIAPKFEKNGFYKMKNKIVMLCYVRKITNTRHFHIYHCKTKNIMNMP